jgi:hypothetical protein
MPACRAESATLGPTQRTNEAIDELLPMWFLNPNRMTSAASCGPSRLKTDGQRLRLARSRHQRAGVS